MRENAYSISIDDVYYFNTGEAQRAYLTFGAHYIPELGGHRFCLWAPFARAVSVVGDFNEWTPGASPMEKIDDVFVTVIKGLKNGDLYKYAVTGADGRTILKADPFAFETELRPANASKICSLEGYEWSDGAYLEKRAKKKPFDAPMSVYELHLGSWRKNPDGSFMNVRDIADSLAEYILDMGYTHIELMPIAEHPLDASWGYQVTGFYSVTSRYGAPADYMYFIDKMHSAGIGVILDWVAGHFPRDEHGLARFDGTCLFEHENPLQGEQPQWGTLLFNYGRPEVVSFLVSDAVFFMDKYHFDGLRLDAVSSMLYLDFARKDFIPNKYGGNHNLEAIEFIQKLNSTVLTLFPGAMTVAEESTAFPLVTMPPDAGGLGFTFKWNMGFMNDTLKYMETDPLYRSGAHSLVTFSMFYAFSENFVLPYSHDEVVHSKRSMLDKMPGEYDQKFASLRLLLGYQYAHPGKKLNFMGTEFGQFIEWDDSKELDWFLLEYPSHAGMQRYARSLNRLYKRNRALYEIDGGWDGFRWLCVDDSAYSIIAFMRSSRPRGGKKRHLVCVLNFTPVQRSDYYIGLPFAGELTPLLNSDDKAFGGQSERSREPIGYCERKGPAGNPLSARLTVPPLSCVYYELRQTDGGTGASKEST